MKEISCATCKNNMTGIGCRLDSYLKKNADYCLDSDNKNLLKIPFGYERSFKQYAYALWELLEPEKPDLIIELDDEDWII